jgi:hypothetical protein
LYLGACGHQCGAEPKTLAGVPDRGKAADGPADKGKTRPSTTPEAPRRGGRIPRASARATPGDVEFELEADPNSKSACCYREKFRQIFR